MLSQERKAALRVWHAMRLRDTINILTLCPWSIAVFMFQRKRSFFSFILLLAIVHVRAYTQLCIALKAYDPAYFQKCEGGRGMLFSHERELFSDCL